MGWLILAALPGQNHRLEALLYPQGHKATQAGGLWFTEWRKPVSVLLTDLQANW